MISLMLDMSGALLIGLIAISLRPEVELPWLIGDSSNENYGS